MAKNDKYQSKQQEKALLAQIKAEDKAAAEAANGPVVATEVEEPTEGTPTQEVVVDKAVATTVKAVESTPVVPSIEEIKATKVATESVVEGVVQTDVDSRIVKLSNSAQFPFASLKTYIDEADLRRPNTSVLLGNLAKRLFTVYRAILTNDTGEFNLCFGLLVAIFKQYRKSVFSDTAVLRGVADFNGSALERLFFERFTSFLAVLADCEDVKQVKAQVNLDFVFDVPFDDKLNMVDLKNRVKTWIG